MRRKAKSKLLKELKKKLLNRLAPAWPVYESILIPQEENYKYRKKKYSTRKWLGDIHYTCIIAARPQ